MANEKSSRFESLKRNGNESGAALVSALLMLGLLSAIAMTVLAVVRTETRIAGSDLKRTQTFYASAAGIEKMTSDFSGLYQQTSRPTEAQVNHIADLYPSELVDEGFTFVQSALTDTTTLSAMRTTQGIADPELPTVTMPGDSAFSGLIATVKPFTLTSRATAADGTQVTLTRNMNNYLIPLFQFGMFSDEDLEIHPGATFTFNGRVHANGNIYVAGLVKFLDKVTVAHEILYDKMRNGADRGTGSVVSMAVGPSATNVLMTKGSMKNGPHIPALGDTSPNWFPGSPTGSVWPTNEFVWKTTSVQQPTGVTDNKFGGMMLTRLTGAAELELPMQLDGNPTREIIKRRLPKDSLDPPALASALSDSRYHTKAKIRILIDDEGVADVASIDGIQNKNGAGTNTGVNLSSFNPIPLPNTALNPSPTANGGGRALWRVKQNNTSVATSYNESNATPITWLKQFNNNGAAIQADTVRSAKAPPPLRNITNVTKPASQPIKIKAVGHGFATGDKVVIASVGGATQVNGTWTITFVDVDNFTLQGTSGTSISTYSANTGTVYSYTAIPKSANGAAIPGGAGLKGHILIQVVSDTGVWRDVTQEILSMGMTVGEPNAIVQLQRPLWAAFTQGSRDGSLVAANLALNGDSAYTNCLTDILNKTHIAADGEVAPTVTYNDPGYLTTIVDNVAANVQPVRKDLPPVLNVSSFNAASMWNSIVPINVYNVREGRLSTNATSPYDLTKDANKIYERGITNVVEINMENLARWVDGVYDNNLLNGTGAVSGNIGKPDGYVVYVSDRRGDKVRDVHMRDPETGEPESAVSQCSNGMADNEDIYGPNGELDGGEDVQYTGELVKDTAELPDPAVLSGTGADTTVNGRRDRAVRVSAWTNPSNFFRRSVRLFNAEDLQTTGAAGKLSTTLGITVASENMVYTWGNYNTAGINQAPDTGKSSLNDEDEPSHYMPITSVALGTTDRQVPSSIVSDAWFPLSKTWFDGLSSTYPDTVTSRVADWLSTGTLAVTQETSVRAGIIAGNNLSAMKGLPDAGNNGEPNESRLCGGMHNFPRFLENWSTKRFNFVGSLIPLYRSTQALGPYNASSSIYGAAVRNWAFDTTFRETLRLPPGTPQFQHIEPTGFRQIL